jgi:hypothetical protein
VQDLREQQSSSFATTEQTPHKSPIGVSPDALKKALHYLLFAVLALVLAAGVAIYLIQRLVLAPGPGEWPGRIKVGPFPVEIGMPTAIRLATASWFGPWLAGRAIDTRAGPVRFGWNASTKTLELLCAPCSALVPSLGSTPIRVKQLKITAQRGAGTLGGEFETLAPGTAMADGGGDVVLRGHWNGQLTQASLQLDIVADDAPIASWYAVFAPHLPELRHARIGGTIGLDMQLTLPGGAYSLRPRIEGFTVDGLGAAAIAGARTSCGPASELSKESWLARAVISAEDQRFFSHPGYDLEELAASLEANQKAARVERGGSTLTQQLAKILVTGGERNTERKLRELLYAIEMEQTLGKERILALYLDNMPWGARICGAETAAHTYFQRSARKLEPAQAVWLAAMLTNPAAAVRKWQQDGTINIERAVQVADGIRGISRGQRETLLKNVAVAKFKAP